MKTSIAPLVSALAPAAPMALVQAAEGLSDSTLHLFGSASRGWGLTADSLSNPGPQIQMVQGQARNFLFHSVDMREHEFFIDLNNDSAKNPGEPDGGDFSTSAGLLATITAETAGQFTYRCKYHPTTMTGSVVVQVASPNPTPGPTSTPTPNPLPYVAIGLAVVAP